MLYGLAYVLTLIAFVAMDAVWLSTVGTSVYRPALGDILLPGFRLGPTLAFYPLYAVGLIAFAFVPALRAGSFVPALGDGVLFGALAYATYDLTNFATLRNWTLQVTLLDMGWGAFASGVATTVGYFLATGIASWVGRS
jgi:uncharacterized membrane protein